MFTNCNPFCPKHRMCSSRPFALVSINGFESRLSNVEVGLLDEPVRTRIVAANLNVVNMISFCEVIEGCDEGRPIIRYDFIEGSPSTNDVFEDPIAEGHGIFSPKFLPFWISH